MNSLLVTLVLGCLWQVEGGLGAALPPDGVDGYYSSPYQPASGEFVAKGVGGQGQPQEYIGILVDTSPVRQAALAQQFMPPPNWVPYPSPY